MNATIRSEEIESDADVEVDSNLAAVTEVEAGIRDFVRNDIAYLRRQQPVASRSPSAARRRRRYSPRSAKHPPTSNM